MNLVGTYQILRREVTVKALKDEISSGWSEIKDSSGQISLARVRLTGRDLIFSSRIKVG